MSFSKASPRLAVVLGLALVGTACRHRHDSDDDTTPEHNAHCLAAGTPMSLGQLVAQAETYQNCDVTTQAVFYASGPGMMTGMNRSGYTTFRVTQPGQAPGRTVLGEADTNYLLVPDAAAGRLFAVAQGTPLELHGHIEHHIAGFSFSGAVDLGSAGRPFVVTSFTIGGGAAPAATSSGGTHP